MKRKVNEFGELICICGCEVWDYGDFGYSECLSKGCKCKKFKQAYE